jgi:hypothetical protein
VVLRNRRRRHGERGGGGGGGKYDESIAGVHGFSSVTGGGRSPA